MAQKGRLAKKYKNSYDEEVNEQDSNIVISFKYTCDKNCLLEDWQRNDLKKLSSTLKIISQITWKQLPGYTGLYYKPIPQNSLRNPLPLNISKDENIFEVRVGNDSARRLFGFRSNNVFNVIWFDLKHEVTKC